MKLHDYLKDKGLVLLVNAAGLFFLSLFLRLSAVRTGDILIICIFWFLILTIWLAADFYRSRKHFCHLFTLLAELDQSYLISEVMEASPRLTDRLYREIIRSSNRSVIEKIHALEDCQRDYKEYIEQWIHEVKLPLTAARLLCENQPCQEDRKLLMELGKIEKKVDQVLFYARMEHAYQDYLIHPVNLRKTVLTAIAENKAYFIQSAMQIDFALPEEPPVIVSTDEKWVVFLLGQVFANSIKYCRKEGALVRIYVQRGKQKLTLIVEDNGLGIPAEDLGRIFDKGFTGKNGRTGAKSTGIGLYLCKRLCDKLGIGLSCESVEGQFTRILFTFPDSDFQKI